MAVLKRNCGNCIYWHPTKKDHVKCRGCCANAASTERPNFMPRNTECPYCEAPMIYDANKIWLSCKDCGTEIAPFANAKTTVELVREEFEKNFPCARNSEVSSVTALSIKGVKSSSKSKGSSKKGLMQKKSTTQIYKELAK
jgi:ribosomal protein S27E